MQEQSRKAFMIVPLAGLGIYVNLGSREIGLSDEIIHLMNANRRCNRAQRTRLLRLFTNRPSSKRTNKLTEDILHHGLHALVRT